MLTLIRAVAKGLRKNVLVLKATIAKAENGRRLRVGAKSTSREEVAANNGTPKNTALVSVRKGAHATPGTPEHTAVITVRKEAHAEPGTPEDTAVNTVSRDLAAGLEREQVGLEFLTPVE